MYSVSTLSVIILVGKANFSCLVFLCSRADASAKKEKGKGREGSERLDGFDLNQTSFLILFPSPFFLTYPLEVDYE